jgi:osmotically-inducible protein OsmY
VKLHGFARSAAVREGLKVLAGEVQGVKRVEDQMQDAPSVVRAMF